MAARQDHLLAARVLERLRARGVHRTHSGFLAEIFGSELGSGETRNRSPGQFAISPLDGHERRFPRAGIALHEPKAVLKKIENGELLFAELYAERGFLIAYRARQGGAIKVRVPFVGERRRAIAHALLECDLRDRRIQRQVGVGR